MSTAATVPILHFFQTIKREGCSWAALHEHISTIPDLTDRESAELDVAYAELRTRFRNRLFQAGHPIARMLCDRNVRAARTILELTAMMRRMEFTEGFTQIEQKLFDPDYAQEGFDLLQFGYGLTDAGCEIAFEPSLRQFNIAKQPDLFIRTPQPCYVELSESRRSVVDQDVWETRMALTTALHTMPVGFIHAGWLHRGLRPAERLAVIRQLQSTVRTALASTAMQILVIPDVLDIAIGPLAELQRMEVWAAERHYEVGHFPGPRRLPIDPKRVWRKINKEAKQLPGKTATLLAVYSSELLLHRSMVEPTIELLNTMLNAHPNVSVLVLKTIYLQSMDEPLSAIQHGPHLAITKDEYFHTSCALFVENETAYHSLPSDLRDCIEHVLETPTCGSTDYSDR